MQKLKAHHANSLEYEVWVDYGVEEQRFWLKASYQGKIYTGQNFTRDGFDNPGLWEYDVIELFLTRGSSHYIELQISPLSQYYSLYIIEPRKITEKWQPQDFVAEVNLSANEMQLACSVSVSDIPGRLDLVQGNIHACLGPETNRNYFGTNINTQEKPDFHLPQNFISLGYIA